MSGSIEFFRVPEGEGERWNMCAGKDKKIDRKSASLRTR